MSILSELQAYKGSQVKRKRVGRGESSGLGKTSGKGHKGQQARSGGGTRPGFEGGQMPLYKKMPKLKGFKSNKSKNTSIINISQLNNYKNVEIDITFLKNQSIISQNITSIKILGDGEISNPINVTANYFSKKALSAIEKAGGKIKVVDEK
jgi:large subunit ribosomal protein L15